MTKRPQVRYRIIVTMDNYSEKDKGFTIVNLRRPVENRKKVYKFTFPRLVKYQSIIRELWKAGRAEPDFTRAYTWGIDGEIITYEPDPDDEYDRMMIDRAIEDEARGKH